MGPQENVEEENADLQNASDCACRAASSSLLLSPRPRPFKDAALCQRNLPLFSSFFNQVRVRNLGV